MLEKDFDVEKFSSLLLYLLIIACFRAMASSNIPVTDYVINLEPELFPRMQLYFSTSALSPLRRVQTRLREKLSDDVEFNKLKGDFVSFPIGTTVGPDKTYIRNLGEHLLPVEYELSFEEDLQEIKAIIHIDFCFTKGIRIIKDIPLTIVKNVESAAHLQDILCDPMKDFLRIPTIHTRFYPDKDTMLVFWQQEPDSAAKIVNVEDKNIYYDRKAERTMKEDKEQRTKSSSNPPTLYPVDYYNTFDEFSFKSNIEAIMEFLVKILNNRRLHKCFKKDLTFDRHMVICTTSTGGVENELDRKSIDASIKDVRKILRTATSAEYKDLDTKDPDALRLLNIMDPNQEGLHLITRVLGLWWVFMKTGREKLADVSNEIMDKKTIKILQEHAFSDEEDEADPNRTVLNHHSILTLNPDGSAVVQ